MPEPEIARRCPTCGVSIREAAIFCPQCGSGLPQQKSAPSSTGVAVAAERTTSKNTSPLNESNPDPQNDSRDDSKNATMNAAPPSTSNQMADTLAIPKTDQAIKTSATETAKAAAAPRVRGAVGSKIQRATTVARNVEGDVMHRARKVRKISSVVLDEAGYDPSLRFVLVAVGLFVLFLIIVFLNKVIT
jgi:hypothetical protein